MHELREDERMDERLLTEGFRIGTVALFQVPKLTKFNSTTITDSERALLGKSERDLPNPRLASVDEFDETEYSSLPMRSSSGGVLPVSHDADDDSLSKIALE